MIQYISMDIYIIKMCPSNMLCYGDKMSAIKFLVIYFVGLLVVLIILCTSDISFGQCFLWTIILGAIGIFLAVRLEKENVATIKNNEIKALMEYCDITKYDYVQFTIGGDRAPVHTFVFCSDEEKLIYANSKSEDIIVIRGKKILECSIIINDSVVQSNTTSNTIIGGMVGGTIGAIIGKSLSSPDKKVMSSLYIRIIQKSTRNPVINISLIEHDANDSSIINEAMQVADRVYGYLLACKYQAEQKEQ